MVSVVNRLPDPSTQSSNFKGPEQDYLNSLVRILRQSFTDQTNQITTNNSTLTTSISSVTANVALLADILTFAYSNTENIQWLIGSGSPNGSVIANPGCIYVSTVGGAGVTFWTKETGIGTNTGWTNFGAPVTYATLGNLPIMNLNSGTGASNATVWRGDDTWSSGVSGTWAANQLQSTVTTGTAPFIVASTTPVTNLVQDLTIPNAYTGQQNTATSALTDASSITWNLNTQQVASLTIAGNRTLAAPTNMVNGGAYVLRITQGVGGSHTLAYNSVFKWPGGVTPILSVAASAIDIITFVSDGTNMYGSILKAFS